MIRGLDMDRWRDSTIYSSSSLCLPVLFLSLSRSLSLSLFLSLSVSLSLSLSLFLSLKDRTILTTLTVREVEVYGMGMF